MIKSHEAAIMNITHFEVITTASCGTFLALAGVYVKLRGPWRRANDLVDLLLGQPKRPNREAIPSVMERLAGHQEQITKVDAGQLHIIDKLTGLETRIISVEAQVNPDHGSSLYDRVKRIEDQGRTGRHRPIE